MPQMLTPDDHPAPVAKGDDVSVWVEKHGKKFRVRELRADGRKITLKTFTREQLAKAYAGNRRLEHERGEAGYRDAYARHAITPLSEHVADWVTTVNQHSPKQAEQYRYRMSRLMSECGWGTCPTSRPTLSRSGV